MQHRWKSLVTAYAIWRESVKLTAKHVLDMAAAEPLAAATHGSAPERPNQAGQTAVTYRQWMVFLTGWTGYYVP